MSDDAGMRRLRDLGIVIGELPTGPLNAITDVADVRVGHTTLISGHGPRRRGHGPVRTGVTVVVPHGGHVWEEPLFAGCHRLNGAGDFTGLEWIRETGRMTTPIAITNTSSVGVVRDALIAADAEVRDGLWFSMPLVAETFDGLLNDVHGFHVRAEHVHQALAAASTGPVAEGCVGGGTGMICHEFKGGIGTSSRVATVGGEAMTVGVLVQANYGRRRRLRIDGVPVGLAVSADEVPVPSVPNPSGAGSIVVIVATDAPLHPRQCDRLAQRAGLAVGRMGGVADNSSGDLFFAFSTAHRGKLAGDFTGSTQTRTELSVVEDSALGPLFEGVVDATEEAIGNCLVAATTMTGCDGLTVHALDPDRLVEVMTAAGRLAG